MSEDADQDLLRTLEKLQQENEHLRSHASPESNSRLAAEQARGHTQDRLQLAVDAAELALWEWDIVNRTIFMSAQLEMILDGCTREQATDREWPQDALLAKVQHEDRVLVRDAYMRVLRQVDRKLEVEFKLATLGSEVWIGCTGRVTQRNMMGRAERMTGVLRDISRRREIQHVIEVAKNTAEQANAAKDQFLAHISHEIRTPLNGVIGMNNLLSKTQLAPEQRKYVDLVASSGQTLLDLVNDVLDFARIEAQGVVLEQIRFPLRRWLSDLAEPQRIAAHAKGLQLLLQVAEDLPQEVVGDPGRLRQIASNLLSNAIKFTTRGRVEVSLHVPSQNDQSMELQLQVRDTGIGIALHKQQTIFDAFVQADSSTSRHYGGTGLGLSICAKLAQLMGGTIELESVPGLGSCFTVRIPVGLAHDDMPMTDFGMGDVGNVRDASHVGGRADSLLPQGSVLPPYAGKRALVVDDNAVNQLLASKFMQRLGFDVVVAEDGEQAVQLAVNSVFDVVLMDIQMPRMNGWLATQTIRQAELGGLSGLNGLNGQGRRVPIIALSAHASTADRDQSIAMGMDGYLTKPLTQEALQAALQAALGLALPLHNTPDAKDKQDSVVNQQLLLKRLGGDAAAVHEMALAFCRDLRERMGLAFDALKRQDWPTLAAQAHALKGALLTMTAQAAAQDAQALEIAAISQDHAAALAAFKALSETSKVAFTAIRSW